MNREAWRLTVHGVAEFYMERESGGYTDLGLDSKTSSLAQAVYPGEDSLAFGPTSLPVNVNEDFCTAGSQTNQMGSTELVT